MSARRKRSSWGCVQRMGAGKYRLRWMERGERRSETVYGTRRQADDAMAAIRVRVGSDHGPRVTVRNAHDLWYMQALGELSPRSVENRESVWRKHVAPAWGDAPIQSIKPADVQAWLLTMTPTTARRALGICRECANLAMLYGAVIDNPFKADYRMPRGSAPSTGQARALDGLRDVWRRVHGTALEGAALLMAFGGARVGEALGARCAEVYELHGCAMVPIVRQMGQRGLTDTLKTSWSRRELAIPGPMGARVLDLASTGREWLSEDAATGLPLAQHQARALWLALVPDGNLRPMKGLRASWQTYMRWELRVAPEHIERMMGHVGEGVTGRHYDKPEPEMFAEVASQAYAARPFADDWDI